MWHATCATQKRHNMTIFFGSVYFFFILFFSWINKCPFPRMAADDRELLLIQMDETRNETRRLREHEQTLRHQFDALPEEIKRREEEAAAKKATRKQDDQRRNDECCRGCTLYWFVHILVAVATGFLYLGIQSGVPIPVPLARTMLLVTVWPIVVFVSGLALAAAASCVPEAAMVFYYLWLWVSNNTTVPMSAPSPSVHSTQLSFARRL